MEYGMGGVTEGIGCTACANYFARKQTKWQSAGVQTEDDSFALPYTVSVVSDICGTIEVREPQNRNGGRCF